MNKVDQIKVIKTNTIKDALALLDQSAMSVLLLVDENSVLRRTITDGDLRRLLLSGNSLDDSLESLEDSAAVTVTGDVSMEKVQYLMDQQHVNQIPVVDEKNRPVDIYLRNQIQPRILLSIPHMGEYERQYVDEAFETNWIAPLGPNVDAFEEEIAAYTGSGYAAALSSGTAAIHLALRLLDVGREDIVLCSSFTFVASANPILYQGASPVFIDSEPNTWNMCPEALEKALKYYCDRKRKPKAIVVVHLYGQSANMEQIMALSAAYDVPVVEDAAESLGALYKGRHTGTFGKFGIFSFNGNKIITTSGGGMLVSDDETLIEKARFLSTQARDPAPYYQHSEVGYNYRMSNVLAGIGRGQLQVLSDRVDLRRSIFKRYKEAFAGIDCIDWMPEPKGDYSNRWLSVFSLNPEKTSITSEGIVQRLASNNIEARLVWKPLHLQPLFKDTAYFSGSKGNSFCDYLFRTSICLPSASNMTIEQQNTVISLVKSILKEDVN
jgi:dTDP-4-amino-4,6-dideoxygalactose transaminase